MILICSLPPAYDHICTTLMYGKEMIILFDVKATLLSNKLRSKVQQQQGPGMGLSARDKKIEKGSSQRSKSRSKSRPKKKGSCHYYKQRGHWKFEYRLYKAKQ